MMTTMKDLRNSKGEIEMYNCELLGNAIVLQAISDYIMARKRLIKKEFNNVLTKKKCEKTVQECLDFFNSREYSIYTTLGKDYIVDTAEKVLFDDFINGDRECINIALLFD